ncbi:MAG: hypothetical protein QNJ38_23445 [Prochloraceae cyanobacterium]|nr:hypothetical protein [Prochloraceae cyanobacterium]
MDSVVLDREIQLAIEKFKRRSRDSTSDRSTKRNCYNFQKH